MASPMLDNPVETETPKKRKKRESAKDKAKFARLSNHTTGDPCKCAEKCHNKLHDDEKTDLIGHFNSLGTKDAQDAYLTSFVCVKPIVRRRPRQDEANAKFRNNTYEYNVQFSRDGKHNSLRVCFDAFKSLFGITGRRVQTIRESLAKTGHAPTDMRGRHDNHPHKLSSETYDAIISHIKSFRGKKSHYALRKTHRLYLPETLNVSKMHQLFLTIHHIDISFETYRKIFTTKFNVGFGYPRKDPRKLSMSVV
ncbi:hypothetical protein Ahia01_001148700 [Argonauta hians]